MNDKQNKNTTDQFQQAKLYKILKNFQEDIKSQLGQSTLESPHPLLGGISITDFMCDYWQKKPLLVRNAIPNYPKEGLIEFTELLNLANDFELPSRFIQYQKKQWRCDSKLPQHWPKTDENWTCLVQKVNTVSPLIQQFMQLFNFLPYARLDDVMVSFATPLSGIGAHVDSYDVFLFQGMGERTWELAANFNPELEEGAPLKLLKNFKPQESYDLKAGDMLYLPPNYAHKGTAKTTAMTYSVGFRAPRADELLNEYFMEQIAFIEQLKERLPELLPETLYTDPDQQPNTEPARIPLNMVDFLQKYLDQLPKMSVSQLLGVYLTRPALNSHINYDVENHLDDVIDEEVDEEVDEELNIPEQVSQLSPAAFGKQKTYYLAYHAQILYDEKNLYLQGEIYSWDDLVNQCELHPKDIENLKYFANHKLIENQDFSLPSASILPLSQYFKRLLYSWYLDDYVWVGE